MKKAAYFLLALLPLANASFAERYTLELNGMDCQHCAKRLEGKLKALDGLQSVSVDLGAKQVELNLVDGQALNKDQVHQILESGGLTLVRIVESEAKQDQHAGH